MKKIFLILVTLFGALALGNITYAGFSLSGTTIQITGTETGDSLRTWINANSPSGWSINGRTITAGGHLEFRNDPTFSDTNGTYILPAAWKFIRNNNNSIITFEDCVIIYTGSAKNHTNVLSGANISLKNVHFRVETTSGRSDFFTPTAKTYSLDNVQFISYSNDFLHLPTTGGDLSDVSVINKAGSLVFQPDTTNGTTLRLFNWKLRGINKIIGNGGRNWTAVTESWNLDWDNTTWTIGDGNRGQYYKVINPIKPAGWSGYAGQYRTNLDKTEEFMTHDVAVIDENNLPITGSVVKLWSNDLSTVEYDTTTDGSGRIIQQLVNTVKHNATNNFTYRTNFQFGVFNYNYKINSGIKALQDGQIEEIILTPTDTNITETTQATVDAYTDIDSLEKLYDRAKSYKLDNLEYPAIQWQVVDGNGSDINLGSKNLVVDGTASSAFAVNQGTNTITIKASAMSCVGDKFTSLTTTGTVSFVNGGSEGDCIFTDSSGTNGVLTLTDLDQANVLVYDDASAGDDTISYQVNQSGDVVIPFSSTSSTDYQVVVRRPGFSEVNFEFNPSSGGFFSFPINQTQALTIEGSTIYQNTGDVSKITMDFVNKKINLGDFVLAAQEVYDTLQDIEVTEAAMKFDRIANFDGNSKVLLLNAYQFRNRDGAATVPGVNAFVFAETGGVLDASNGSVQFLTTPTASANKQEQIVAMLEAIQGSTWNNTNTDDFDRDEVNLTSIAGDGFDTTIHALSKQVDHMLERGIVDINTLKDLLE